MTSLLPRYSFNIQLCCGSVLYRPYWQSTDSPCCTYRCFYSLQESLFWILNVTTWIINQSTGNRVIIPFGSEFSYKSCFGLFLFFHLFVFLNPKTIEKFYFHKLGTANFPHTTCNFLSLIISYLCH